MSSATASRQTIKTPAAPQASVRPSVPSVLLQRKSAEGNAAGMDEECDECKKGLGVQRLASGTGGPPVAPPIVHEVLRSPGQPLDAGARAFMEPRFGHDFSRIRVVSSSTPQAQLTVNEPGDEYEQEADRVAESVAHSPEPARTSGHDFAGVRVHTDVRAAESAREVRARAYTVGHHIVFGDGQYDPSSTAGRRLLAHELTHVLQQQAGESRPVATHMEGASVAAEGEASKPTNPVGLGLFSMSERSHTAPAALQRACGPWGVKAAVASSTGCTAQFDKKFLTGRPTFRFNFECDTFAPGEDSRLRQFAAPLTPTSFLEIHGFASSDGPQDFNENLGCARAIAARQVLITPKPDPDPAKNYPGLDASQITSVVNHGPVTGDTDENLRSVVILQTVPTVIEVGCPPAFSQASTLDEYLELVVCAEQAMPGTSPRDMLSLLRQIYYGARSWSNKPNPVWDQIIPCGNKSLPDPRPVLGPLYDKLLNSQVVAGTDIGHVYTGLEAMFCPAASFDITVVIKGITFHPKVNDPNEEFATWGGDLGSAVAQKVWDEKQLGLPPKPYSKYIGGAGTLASDEDLGGDIDAYAIRKGLTGAACAATPQTPLTSLAGPVSEVLGDYYYDSSTPVGAERGGRFACFAQALGAVISGKHISNKSDIEQLIAWRITEASVPLYALLINNNRSFGSISGAIPLDQLRVESILFTREFLKWLERRL